MKSFLFLVITAFFAFNANYARADTGGDTQDWGYNNKNASLLAPDQWYQAHEACNGDRQSPINFNSNHHDKCDQRQVPLQFKSHEASFSFKSGFSSYKWDVIEGSPYVEYNNKEYKLLGYHMHTPSEHTVDGQQMEAEFHLVHKYSDDDYIVTGAFIVSDEYAADNAWINELLMENFPEEGSKMSVDDVYGPLSSSKNYYNYLGSLTTPGCNEFVEWWVARQPVVVSKRQIKLLEDKNKELLITDNGKNARPVQDLGDRIVTIY